jgi:RhoGAP domain
VCGCVGVCVAHRVVVVIFRRSLCTLFCCLVVHGLCAFFILFLAESLKSTGIFRVSGAKWEVDNYVRRFDAGEHIDFHGADPHCVAGVLKQWFLQLPSPVVPCDQYSPFLSVYGWFFFWQCACLYVHVCDASMYV